MYSSHGYMLQDFLIVVIRTPDQPRMLINRIARWAERGRYRGEGRNVSFASGGFYRLSEIIFRNKFGRQPNRDLAPNIQPVENRSDRSRTAAVLYHRRASLDTGSFMRVPLDRKKTGAGDAIIVSTSVSQEWESAPDWVG